MLHLLVINSLLESSSTQAAKTTLLKVNEDKV